jgi:hypothetical protein
VVIVDVLPTNAIEQAAGRVHRFGQRNEQSCTIYLIDRTFDMAMHAKYVDRTIAQLATTTVRAPVSEAVTAEIVKNMAEQIEHVVKRGKMSPEDAIEAIAHVQQVEHDFILSAGIRSPRANPFYKSEGDPDKKLALTYEWEFFSKIPVYQQILEDYKQRATVGMGQILRTPGKKKNTKSTIDVIRANYHRVEPSLMSPHATPTKTGKIGEFGQLSKSYMKCTY